MSEYTKGPWFENWNRVFTGSFGDPDSELICVVDGDSNAKANAHLIAAAPELYEALKGYMESEWMVTHDWGGDRDAVREKAEKAINKAEGKP